MKRAVLILIAVFAVCLLAGCGGQAADSSTDGGSSESASAESVDLDSIKTLGDAFVVGHQDGSEEQRATTQGKYIYVFKVNDVDYRVIADLPSDIEDKIIDLEFDDDHDKNEMALVEDLPVSTAEDLTEQILTQEELDALVGKTGQELADMGWREGSFYNGETVEVWLEYGPYAYDFHFDGEEFDPDADGFDVFQVLADRKVQDAAFEGLGDATNIE